MSSTHNFYCPITKRSLWFGQGHGKDFYIYDDLEELKKFLKDHYGLPLFFCDEKDYYEHADDLGVHHLNPEDYGERSFSKDDYAENEQLKERVSELENDLLRIKMLWSKLKRVNPEFFTAIRFTAALTNLLESQEQ